LVQGIAPDSRQGVYLIDIRTGNTTTVVQGRIGTMACSPDGQQLFYVLFDDEYEPAIVVRNLATRQTHELHRQCIEGSLALDISPDGTELAFTYGRSLRVMPTGGGPPRVLWTIPDEDDARFEGGLTWTRDGKHLLIGKKQSKASDINLVWRISSQGGEPQPIGLEMLSLAHLRISPDGRQITFTGKLTTVESEVWVLENLPLPSTEVAQSQ
jgi:Tol biopolymer transport system component